MKKFLLIIPALLVILVGLWFFVFRKGKEEEAGSLPSPTPSYGRINELKIEKRSYITLMPREDGKEIFLTIENLKGDEKKVEYEMEYLAGNMIKGVLGRIDFSKESVPVTKKLLLGSCSRGVCKYDEGVSGGNLTVRFSNGQNYALRGDFTLSKMSDVDGKFVSKDGKATLDVGKDDFSSDTYLIVFDTLGLPGALKEKLLLGPYGFFTSGKSQFSQVTLTFKIDKTDNVKVLGWSNGKWKEYSQDLEKGPDSIAVQVDQLTTFVLVEE